ncbi:MAG: D-Ala-D-Ala carboxypeptidase family metallohydrolase [Reichenbachiella sp.]|uniref:D-Ala-D-Ala carboxypeptidase family metallohydrolase n=1 Tax=Reichenbachiella sp. TaxID=2184521 RepID=UPI00296735D0|nr:D-Ala-D-Ala carboxypeptidase family metallohydrolase [Reichenbachiella sp.]MDW3210121.1 D-Ala-D-Ala carboxypeptidase family metallohydrolase [Reichenbachiella sp.]
MYTFKSFIAASLLLMASSVWGYQNERANFTIEVNGEINPYNVFSVFVMPEKEFKVSSVQNITMKSQHLTINGLSIKSPSNPGIYPVQVIHEGGEEMLLNVMVLTPITEKKGEYLSGYRIGNYPTKPLRDNPIYNRPTGLFEVTKENENTKLTPHFTLKQFLCKQAGDYPKYVIIRERLLLKLEYLLEKTNRSGYAIETFGFISGYRTPFYNKSIKNVQYSRHVYGGAADIFIDQDKNGAMDDLNKDGVIDEKDVRIFYQIVDNEYDKKDYHKFRGGLGFYKRNKVHHGFIHVDVRGTKARW